MTRISRYPVTRLLLVLMSMMALLACNMVDEEELRIDATTEESAERTFNEIVWSLPPEQQEAFERAAMLVATESIGVDELADLSRGPRSEFEATVTRSLDGKTARAILAEAERLRAEGKSLGLP